MNENLDIAAILCDSRFNFRYGRTFAACLSYHGKPATIAELVAVSKIPARTLKYQLSALRCIGIITADKGKNRIGLVTVHNPDKWDHNRAAHLGTPEPPAATAPAAISKPELPTEEEFDPFTAPILQGTPLPPNVTRDYAAELKILDSHPALRGRIRLSWLAYLERKYGQDMSNMNTSLLALCDVFVHEWLGKNTGRGVAAKRLADPKTDWETTLLTHVMLNVAPTELRQKRVLAGARAQQAKFHFSQRRPATPAKHPTPAASRAVPVEPPAGSPTTRLGATSTTAAALANPVLAQILKGA